jgi:hypothetical protein
MIHFGHPRPEDGDSNRGEFCGNTKTTLHPKAREARQFADMDVDGSYICSHIPEQFTNFGQHYRCSYIPLPGR